jgi:hypothetical protein
MQFMLLIYEDESIYGPGKNGPAMQQIVAKHMAFLRSSHQSGNHARRTSMANRKARHVDASR